MASRASVIHQSLNRPRLILGVEKAAFGGLALAGAFAMVAQTYWGLPVIFVVYLLARWLSKRDPLFVAILLRYLGEGHVYDATPRMTDINERPRGWGKGLPR